MDDATVLTIAELIQHAVPLTGTFNLYHSPPSNPIPVKSFKSNLKHTTSTPSESNGSPKVLSSLNHPVIIVGTLNLPTAYLEASNPKSSCRCPKNNCFQFSDGSAAICCDILDINVRMLGKEIRVLSWNFIPLRNGSGAFLEIIKWDFCYRSSGLTRCSNVYPVLLDRPTCSASDDTLKSRCCLSGALDSVASVNNVSCSVGQINSQTNELTYSSRDSKNLRGFTVRILVCECRSCTSGKTTSLPVDSVREHETHSFIKSKIVYLCGSASSWHPVLTKVVGRFITFWGLKKKLFFIDKAESRVMYVSTEKSSLHLPKFSHVRLPWKKNTMKGEGECDSYTGIVRGVYMQGMLLELDNEVWLLLTDRLLSPPHSLRVGATVSVRNVHFVNPRFPWSKLLILGACVKTSIFVQLFSPFETECHVISQSSCMLEKLIETLPFSARLWVLLLISSFRKMFAGVLSEKEILGSIHTEGLVQSYAKLHLPSSIYRYRHGAMMTLSEHDSCGCDSETCNFNLGSVVPVSILIFYCNVTWMRTIRSNEKVIKCENNQIQHFRLLPCQGRTRKVYQSEDIGFVLVGSLKISTSSGRLQLVDVTGGIDVMVPDLPSTWDEHGIYEVTKYCLVIEGIPQMEKYLADESFSCRNFFHSISRERDLKLAVHIHFYYRNATCRNLPLYSCIENGYDLEVLERGTYHLLQITHKFPILQKGKQLVPNTSSLFIEAVIYSWNLFLGGRDKVQSAKSSMKRLIEDSLTTSFLKYADKRPKIDDQQQGVEDGSVIYGFSDSRCGFNAYFDYYEELTEEQKHCNMKYHRISCLASVRSSKHSSQGMLGFLFNNRSKSSSAGGSKSNCQRVLLEFNCESFLKYQFLQIGKYYIIKHDQEHSLCNIKEEKCVNSHKVLITSSTCLWGISFAFDDDLLHSIALNKTQLDDFSFSDGVVSRGQIDIQHGTFPDISLYLPAKAKNCLVLSFIEQEEGLIVPVSRSEEISNMSSLNIASSATEASVFQGLNHLCPEGNLLSLQGHVVEVYDFAHSYTGFDSKCQHIKDSSLCRFVPRGKSFSCIHLLVDDQIVKIFGTLKKYTLPVGFGPGVNATFHRVLDQGNKRILMLTPISFIDVNSFQEFSCPLIEKYPDSIPYSDTISLKLFSELTDSYYMPTKFRCRVVAVNILVLEKSTNCVDLQFENSNKQPLVNIPLFGFIMDDGSSKCNCWASGGEAATLLQLRNPLPHLAFDDIYWTSKWTGMVYDSNATTNYHLERVLRNHGRIVVRSCGSMLDSYPDLDISLSSGNALSSADEGLIKWILVNACFGAIWTIIGSQLNSNAVQSLLKGNIIEPEWIQSHNIWVSNVNCTDALNEAKNAFLELMDR